MKSFSFPTFTEPSNSKFITCTSYYSALEALLVLGAPRKSSTTVIIGARSAPYSFMCRVSCTVYIFCLLGTQNRNSLFVCLCVCLFVCLCVCISVTIETRTSINIIYFTPRSLFFLGSLSYRNNSSNYFITIKLIRKIKLLLN